MKKVKQLFTLSVMILASMLLLAHAVMPHSHHDGIVCFSHDEVHRHLHCTDNVTDCACHHEGKHHHQHEDCDLKEIVLRQANDSHEDILPCANCLSLLFTVYTLNALYLEAPAFGERFQEKPYIENYTPPFVGTIRSLRAPPVSYFLG
ncbi:DUF6769 family protein [Prevotella sp. 10(H)]|uniref:DUF6769 family protein n=1 Tax=Prevotella sp. 10(H) TaxID=1158294 RepID=UPI000691AF55|nr:DUF6769 family protein [Prevotella sp. 10(H)]